ncbi:hypothetical protein [Bacillus suaedae]|uniref:DUF3953 domain-containing protein n=1 Tax=Halalkalibacter suaedae TaxID=2822140 RepID=A0A940WTA0_9BACI|nr:hypothetical protein [Bacillus suaedae]MBP3950237.1 hypothetical protein [Bacillus suaedae]
MNENDDKKVSYLIIFFGGVGTILILLGAINLFENGYLEGYYFVLFGFLLLISYINYLESKAGVSKKITWLRVLLSIIVTFILSYFLYF